MADRKRDALAGGTGVGVAAGAFAVIEFLQRRWQTEADLEAAKSCQETCLALIRDAQTQLDTCIASAVDTAQRYAATAAAQQTGFQESLLDLAKLCQ